jgi:hypothetical protein
LNANGNIRSLCGKAHCATRPVMLHSLPIRFLAVDSISWLLKIVGDGEKRRGMLRLEGDEKMTADFDVDDNNISLTQP